MMQSKKVIYNYHRWCLLTETLRREGVDQRFDVLASSRDREGREYAIIVESKKYPIFGVQFHPEKSQFEFQVKEGHEK